MIEKFGWFWSLVVAEAGLLGINAPGFLVVGTSIEKDLLLLIAFTLKIPLKPCLSSAVVLLALAILFNLTFESEVSLCGSSDVTVATPAEYVTSWIILIFL